MISKEDSLIFQISLFSMAAIITALYLDYDLIGFVSFFVKGAALLIVGLFVFSDALPPVGVCCINCLASICFVFGAVQEYGSAVTFFIPLAVFLVAGSMLALFQILKRKNNS